ncbi:MAG TPA: aminotransferase class I/II-fold pyridoxal phosphate-dependent enzyme [Chloroflexota bacterium]|nr:aminotransferase class I/II-fold pyridoxal phosphate-dependent enzyme [Chloroflexota bacterium]
MSDDRAAMAPSTVAVHGGERRPGPEGSVVFPIYQGTVYSVPPGTDYHAIKYIRLNSTPSQEYLHDKLAALEGGEAAIATASGMAAITTTLLAFLSAGDHLIAVNNLYGGTMDFLIQETAGLGWSYTFVDPCRPETWEAAVTERTRVFLTETITNPLMRVPRLAEMVDFCRRFNLVSVIDNTFATPINFRPLDWGFDVACHSATKYLNGHSDLVAGCVIGSADTIERVRHRLNLFGGSLDPHAGFLLARGIKTLAVRVAAHNANAMAVAEFLERHPAVREINYPGLPSHPDRAHASQLLSGFGGMMSFRLREGAPAAERLLDALQLPTNAPSLGGVESLITQPVKTSHAGMRREDRERIGVTDDLIRLSVGIEGSEDLIRDFSQALDVAASVAVG